MPGPHPDITLVTALLQEIATSAILPRFRELDPADILHKTTADGGPDIVTVVDREVEVRLTQALNGLAPASVIGEEAAYEHPDQLQLIHADDALWIIDPIDGTKNFARGHDAFGVMVAWVVEGRARASWVLLPARRQMFVAEAGGGVWLNGVRVKVPASAPPVPPRASLHQRYMPAEMADAMTRKLAGTFTPVADLVCSAIEYTDILLGRQEFTTYYRLLPWDHTAPALMLTEAGGVVEHLNGEPYTVRSPNQVTIVARDTEMSARVRRLLLRANSQREE